MKRLALLCLVLLTGCITPNVEPAMDTATVPPVVPAATATAEVYRLMPISGQNLTRSADGMMMVDVPAGEFQMGSEQGKDSNPVHAVYLDEFWIDQTEVTNGMYSKCVQMGLCTPPILKGSAFREHYFDDPQYADFPVVYVSLHQARAYCSWAGARVPTEAEWEKAARGTDGRNYPWGNEPPTCDLANYQGCNLDTVAVGSFPANASPYGALDMAGNVWEYVNDWYGEAYYSASPRENPAGPEVGDGGYGLLRGGGWSEAAMYLYAWYRLDDGPDNMYPNYGFRCAVSGK